ncbi:hypothetical protein K4K59_004542 [Colletotrichum sp. SAR11_240]|nr:hypothetical protein K4K59_004542 [Colletotrichum sp. SAR11_240]
MSSRKPDYVLREVVAVREDQGQLPSILPLQFELRVRCSAERLLLFRLAISLAGSAFDKTAETNVYLHITADFLDSLDHTVCDKSDTNARNPSYLDSVRRQLKGTNSIARLRFQLLRGKHIQLAVPKDFIIDELDDDVARSTFENAESLAAASTFSLYLPHNILSSDSVPKYKDAIERSRTLTDALRQGYERMRDVNRLYRGAGGKVHQPHDRPHGWSPRKENSSPLAPGSSPSCGSTLPFDDVSRGSPPPYNGSLGGEQSPTTKSNAAAILAANPESDHSPPEYSDAEPRGDVPDSLQGVFPNGIEDLHAHPTPQRKRPFVNVSPTTTSATDAPRPEKLQRPLAVCSAEQLMRMFEEQQRQIDRLHQKLEESQERNTALEKRYEELEEKCHELENRQAGYEGSLDSVDITVDDLEARCSALENQMPDVCDEVKGLIEDIGRTTKEDFCTTIDDSMAKAIEETVDAQVKKVKDRIWKALQPI